MGEEASSLLEEQEEPRIQVVVEVNHWEVEELLGEVLPLVEEAHLEEVLPLVEVEPLEVTQLREEEVH